MTMMMLIVVVMKTLAATTIVMMMDGVYVKSNCGFVYMKTLIKSEKMTFLVF